MNIFHCPRTDTHEKQFANETLHCDFFFGGGGGRLSYKIRIEDISALKATGVFDQSNDSTLSAFRMFW